MNQSLARNGVWFINSGGQGFTAVDYTINKVSDIGITARQSAVVAGDVLFWWTRQGIQAITPATGQFGAIPGQFTQQNITENTIKTFYGQINEYTRENCKGVFDPATSTVYWLYYDIDADAARKVLKYDLRFNAFIPQSVVCPAIAPMDMFVGEYYTQGTQYDTFVVFLSLESRWNGKPGGSTANKWYHWLVTSQFIDPTYVDGRTVVESFNKPGPPL